MKPLFTKLKCVKTGLLRVVADMGINVNLPMGKRNLCAKIPSFTNTSKPSVPNSSLKASVLTDQGAFSSTRTDRSKKFMGMSINSSFLNYSKPKKILKIQTNQQKKKAKED
jgi:hypothetical protein